MPVKFSSRIATPLVLGSLGFFALHCSSDEGSTNGTGGGGTLPMSGSGGLPAGGSSAGVSGGGMTAGGSSAGSTTAGSAGAPGGSGGSGGSAAGAGGGGAGGAGGGGAGGGSSGSGGGSGVTFAQVKEVLAASCKGSKCHDAGNERKNVDLITADGLYTRLTMPIAADISHCDGTTMVVPGNVQMSFLITAVAGPGNGKVSCKKGGGTEMIARMPDDCPDQRPCLTADKIKLLQDWVAAGAPQ